MRFKNSTRNLEAKTAELKSSTGLKTGSSQEVGKYL